MLLWGRCHAGTEQRQRFMENSLAAFGIPKRTGGLGIPHELPRPWFKQTRGTGDLLAVHQSSPQRSTSVKRYPPFMEMVEIPSLNTDLRGSVPRLKIPPFIVFFYTDGTTGCLCFSPRGRDTVRGQRAGAGTVRLQYYWCAPRATRLLYT